MLVDDLYAAYRVVTGNGLGGYTSFYEAVKECFPYLHGSEIRMFFPLTISIKRYSVKNNTFSLAPSSSPRSLKPEKRIIHLNQARNAHAVINHNKFSMMAAINIWIYGSRLEKIPERRHKARAATALRSLISDISLPRLPDG